jgi:hypothetical protein
MSVTFFCPDAPTTNHTCQYCEDTRKWHAEGDYNQWPILDGEIIRDEARIAALTPGEMARLTCRPGCNGTQEVSVAPEANFANATARGVLALLGLDAEELYGEATPEQCRGILQRIMRLANTEGAVAGLDREATDERQTRIETVDGMPTFTQGPRMIGVPNTSADTLRRIEYLREIFSYGASHNTKVCWG